MKVDRRTRFLALCLFLTILFGVLSLCFLHKVKLGNKYYTKQEVALYIKKYQTLPPNFVTKTQIQNVPDKTGFNVGGNQFQNKDGLIANPQKLYMQECDIYSGNCNADNRGAERLVFFYDGSAVFYTSDHYGSFVKMGAFLTNTTSCIMAIFAAFSFAAFLVAACISVSSAKKAQKPKPFSEVVLSAEMVVVSTVLFALMPVTLVVWIAEMIMDAVRDKGSATQ